MINKLLFGLIGLVILIPTSLFFGFKISPLGWGLMQPVNNDGGIALRGYDPVAYFTDDKAIPGDPEKGLLINGMVYRFSSEENKLMFKTFPDRYFPQYGGYCAAMISSGFTADIKPEQWLIVNNKLYLFSGGGSKNNFNQQLQDNIIKKADSEWAHH